MSADFCIHTFALDESVLSEEDFRCFMENTIGSKYFYETFQVECKNCSVNLDYREIHEDIHNDGALMDRVCPRCSHHVEVNFVQKACSGSFCKHWERITATDSFLIDETSWSSTYAMQDGREVPNLCDFFGGLIHDFDGYPFHNVNDDLIKQIENYQKLLDEEHYAYQAIDETIVYLQKHKGKQVFSVVH